MKIKRLWVLSPVFGTLLFVLLYILAAVRYPGGSQADVQAEGFSWIHNYWCNLLNEKAINGLPNPARPLALAGTFVLCVTFSCFWFLFPGYTHFGKRSRLVIQWSGTLSMLIALFIFSSYHDIITYIASFFGMIAVVGTFIGLYKIKWYGLFAFGMINLLLVVLNNYVYYTEGMILYLPVIQKVTFVTFLFWICWIDVELYRKTDSELLV